MNCQLITESLAEGWGPILEQHDACMTIKKLENQRDQALAAPLQVILIMFLQMLRGFLAVSLHHLSSRCCMCTVYLEFVSRFGLIFCDIDQIQAFGVFADDGDSHSEISQRDLHVLGMLVKLSAIPKAST